MLSSHETLPPGAAALRSKSGRSAGKEIAISPCGNIPSDATGVCCNCLGQSRLFLPMAKFFFVRVWIELVPDPLLPIAVSCKLIDRIDNSGTLLDGRHERLSLCQEIFDRFPKLLGGERIPHHPGSFIAANRAAMGLG